MKHNEAKIFLVIWVLGLQDSYFFFLFLLNLGSEIVAHIKSNISQTKKDKSVQSLDPFTPQK